MKTGDRFLIALGMLIFGTLLFSAAQCQMKRDNARQGMIRDGCKCVEREQ